MNDTVSEDVKLDEAGVEAARDAYERVTGEVTSKLALRHAVRAYLAATKPPLAGEVEWPPIIELGKTLAFYTSVIKSGESWSPECAAAYDRANKALQDLYAAPASPPMPVRGEGFVLVPVEATDAMKLAGLESLDWHLAPEGSEHDAAAINNSYLSTVSDVYRAMLAASRPKEDTHAE